MTSGRVLRFLQVCKLQLYYAMTKYAKNLIAYFIFTRCNQIKNIYNLMNPAIKSIYQQQSSFPNRFSWEHYTQSVTSIIGNVDRELYQYTWKRQVSFVNIFLRIFEVLGLWHCNSPSGRKTKEPFLHCHTLSTSIPRNTFRKSCYVQSTQIIPDHKILTI